MAAVKRQLKGWPKLLNELNDLQAAPQALRDSTSRRLPRPKETCDVSC